MNKLAMVEYQENRGRETAEKIRKFYADNPFTTAAECARHIGMSPEMVRIHVRRMKKGAENEKAQS